MTDGTFFQTAYSRAACRSGIVHIGYGAFHRAHQSVYVDDYMQASGDLRWGITAVNLRAAESESFAQAAEARDGYLIKSIAPDGTVEFRAVRSHVAFVDGARDMEAALDLLSDKDVHVASMTVTESGYAFNADWSLNLYAPEIRAELDGGPITTIYGYLAHALSRRAATLNAPITLLCCDNIRNNGRVLEGALKAYISAMGRGDLVAWLEANASFPCSMVDRITPRATPALEDEVTAMFPANATAPIHAEAFSQWVLEDRFAAPMPDLARVGVEVVTHVEPYEEAKIRILNGGHTGLCYLGALAGHGTFDQAMADPHIRPYFDAFEREDVLPGLGGEVPFDTTAYLAEIAARFENAGIADQLERICMDGYSKMAIYIRPTLRACLEAGLRPRASYDCVASWVIYARRVAAGTMPVTYTEPFWDALAPLLAVGQEEALARDTALWGQLPQKFETFVPDLVAAIKRMDEKWQV